MSEHEQTAAEVAVGDKDRGRTFPKDVPLDLEAPWRITRGSRNRLNSHLEDGVSEMTVTYAGPRLSIDLTVRSDMLHDGSMRWLVNSVAAAMDIALRTSEVPSDPTLET